MINQKSFIILWVILFGMAILVFSQGTTNFTEIEEPVGESSTIIQPGFKEIVLDNGVLNLVVWIMIAGVSFTTITFSINILGSTKRPKLIPDRVVFGVRSSLSNGDLDAAVSMCQQNPGPFSTILLAGLSNIYQGFEAIQEAVDAATELESEKIHQRINYLNLCGQIAPMLGLLGTVIGMVNAFSGLAGEAGAAKTQLLALAISGALWTTVAGLLVSVPALLSYTIFKNLATKLLLESQVTVVDLVKILRGVKIDG